jgi:hypothetical protein
MPDVDKQPSPILRVLQSIKDALGNIKEAIQEKRESDEGQRKGDIHAKPKVVVSLPVEVTEYYNSENRDRSKENSREIIRLFLEGGGIVVALIIAGLSLYNVIIVRGQLFAMQDQLHYQYGAHLRVKNEEGSVLNLKDDKYLHRSEPCENFGSNPAKNIGIVTDTEVLEAKEEPTFQYPGLAWHMTAGLLYPGDTKTCKVEYMQMKRIGIQLALSDEIRKGLLDGSLYVVMYGRATYHDRFGEHWFQFCQWTAADSTDYREFYSRKCAQDYPNEGDGAPPWSGLPQ